MSKIDQHISNNSLEIKVSASILAADFTNLQTEMEQLNNSGVDYIHLDIMDGHFVPNLTFGAKFVAAINKLTDIPLDCHLMISNPEKYIDIYASSGADIITVHAEATHHLDRMITAIKKLGKKAGVALNPATDEAMLNYLYDKLDYILVMTVNPGFHGQDFIYSQVRKIERIRMMLDKTNSCAELAVDGGINAATSKLCIAAGARVLVAGQHIFGNKNYAQKVSELKN